MPRADFIRVDRTWRAILGAPTGGHAMRTIQAAGPNGLQFDNDQAVPAELVEHLYRAGESRVGDLVSGFSVTQRANLAVYCYHKAHLHRIGLAIAATCE